MFCARHLAKFFIAFSTFTIYLTKNTLFSLPLHMGQLSLKKEQSHVVNGSRCFLECQLNEKHHFALKAFWSVQEKWLYQG